MQQITDQDKRERYDQIIALAEEIEEQEGFLHFYEFGERVSDLLEEWGFFSDPDR